MALDGPIREAFRRQAEACRSLGSPFTARLCERLVAVLDVGTPLGRAVAGWGADPVESALPLRVCGALHRVVRAGRAPALAPLYPSGAGAAEAPESGALDAALRETAATLGEALAGLLESAPQTNEVGRSGVLLGGLLVLARETGMPLALDEIGSSAGLNLHPDCYAYDLGEGRRYGPAAAALTVACAWRGACPPLDAPLGVAARAGADRAPLDPADAAARERLLSYIWPDQPERLARTEAALDHAAAHRAPVERAEAADWAEARLARAPEPGRVRVLMHSITWQYLPAPSRARIAAALDAAGARATAEAPLAWLRLEPDGRAGSAALTLTLWPGGAERALGRGDYHGRFADWSAA